MRNLTALLLSTTLLSLALQAFSFTPSGFAQASDLRKAEADQLLKFCRENLQQQQYEAVIQACQEAVESLRQRGNRNGEARGITNLGVAYLNLSQPDKAINYLRQSLSMFQAEKDRGGEVIALSNLGVAYYALGNYLRSIEYQEQSLEIAREIKNRLGEGAALGNLGNVYYALGNYPRSIDYHQRSLAVAREIKNRLGEGQSLGNLGNAYYALGNYGKAIEYYQQSLAIAREIKDRRGEASALGNLGSAYDALGNYPKAIEYYQQSLAIAQKIKDRRGEGNALGNLGNAYNALGNYGKAIEYQEQRLVITREIKDRLGEGQSLGKLGSTYLSLGNYGKAIEYYQQSLAIAQKIKDRRGEGNALGNLSNVYYALGNYGKAIEYQEQSLEISRKIKDRLGEGQSLGNLGSAYYALGNYGKAIEYQEQSLEISREIKNRRGEAFALGNLGSAYDALGNYPKAIEYQEQRLAIAQEIKDRRGEGQALNNLGATLFKSGKLAEAEPKLLAAIQVYESLRQNLSDSQKVSIADTQRNPYNTLQLVLIAQNKVELALEITERGRARAFAELLANRTQGKESLAIQPIQITAIQEMAREPKATLVEYANIYNEQLFIWVVKPTGAVAFRQVDLKLLKQQNTSLDNLVAAARCLGVSTCEQQVASRSDKPLVFNAAAAERQASSLAIPTQENSHLQQLHSLLIEPITDLLPKDPTERIIFMPQGQLFLVPFAALQDKQGQYLIDRHTIAYAPSIQLLQLTRQQRQRLGTSLQSRMLLVGNPMMPKLSRPGNLPTQLSALPGAEKEANAISKLLQVPALIGSQATKSTVVRQMLSARIIHLATHGLLDDFGGGGVPGAIALAPDQPGETNNGLLTSNELLDLKLEAELVVLSACDTGQGRITGDGVIGLSRALITAGVPSVIVSLWAVPDAPTSDLMIHFYQNLNQGQDKATALRAAMLTTKQDYPNPATWAAFVLIGEAL